MILLLSGICTLIVIIPVLFIIAYKMSLIFFNKTDEKFYWSLVILFFLLIGAIIPRLCIWLF